MQIGVETAKAVDQRRIFVIEPDEILRTALQFMLQDEIETHELATLEAAYDKGQGWLKPNLVLLGETLLTARGDALLAELAARFPGVRVILIARPSGEAKPRVGLHGVISLPLNLAAVRKTVDTVLGRAGGAPLIQLLPVRPATPRP